MGDTQLKIERIKIVFDNFRISCGANHKLHIIHIGNSFVHILA